MLFHATKTGLANYYHSRNNPPIVTKVSQTSEQKMAKRRKAIPRLAEGELEILQMLWREHAVTILEAKTALNLPIGYTTVQTRLNRLVKKGVVKKTERRPARYSASITSEQVHAKDLDTLVDRVSGGRVAPLVAHLINREDVSAQEIRELKKLLKEAESRNRNTSVR